MLTPPYKIKRTKVRKLAPRREGEGRVFCLPTATPKSNFFKSKSTSKSKHYGGSRGDGTNREIPQISSAFDSGNIEVLQVTEGKVSMNMHPMRHMRVSHSRNGFLQSV